MLEGWKVHIEPRQENSALVHFRCYSVFRPTLILQLINCRYNSKWSY